MVTEWWTVNVNFALTCIFSLRFNIKTIKKILSKWTTPWLQISNLRNHISRMTHPEWTTHWCYRLQISGTSFPEWLVEINFISWFFSSHPFFWKKCLYVILLQILTDIEVMDDRHSENFIRMALARFCTNGIRTNSLLRSSQLSAPSGWLILDIDFANQKPRRRLCSLVLLGRSALIKSFLPSLPSIKLNIYRVCIHANMKKIKNTFSSGSQGAQLVKTPIIEG